MEDDGICLIFIVGVGRSGTSLLQSMIGSHPGVAMLPETSFVRRFLMRRQLEKEYLRGGVQGVVSALSGDKRIQRLGMDINALVLSALTKKSNNLLDALVYDEIRLIKAGGKDITGDKDPRAVEIIPLILHIWKRAEIIHVIRDPRDILLSKQQAEWSRGHGIMRNLFANRVQLKMGRASRREMPVAQYHELIYEQLLKEPESELRHLCGELGLDFSTSLLDFESSAIRLTSSDETEWKGETLGPLLSTNYNKWKAGLPNWKIALTELVCSEHFAVGKYERSECIHRLGLLEKFRIYAMAAVIISLDPIYRLYRKWTILKFKKHV